MPEIRAIDPATDRVKRARRILGRSVRGHIEQQGAGLAGFCLVSWDMRGGIVSSYLTEYGPVSRSIMPAVVHDALNRHVAQNNFEDAQSTIIPGDE